MQYFNNLNQWLAIKRVLGVGNESGLLAELEIRAGIVEQQVSGFAQMEQQFVKVKAAQQAQLINVAAQKQDTFEQTMMVLTELINELEFIELLPAVEEYQQSFLAAQNKNRELQQVEKQLLAILPKVELLTKQAAEYISLVLLPKVVASNKQVSSQSRITLLIAGLLTAAMIMFLLLLTGKSISKGLRKCAAA